MRRYKRGIGNTWNYAMTRSNLSIAWAISGEPFAPVSHN